MTRWTEEAGDAGIRPEGVTEVGIAGQYGVYRGKGSNSCRA